jgi:CheY-like chemotaxis protein
MALHSLLFSRDQEIVTLVVEALKGLDIEVAHCSGPSEAVERLSSTRFDAIIVDNSDAPAAVVVLSAAKSFPSCEHSIGVVLAASRASIGLADGARSHMVLYRPLSADRLRNGIKSALKLRNQGEDARESQRANIAMKIPATLRGAGQDEALGFIINLSAGGAALQVGPSIPSSSIHSIEFFLPHTNENLSCPVELVWRDVHGRVGVRFAGQSTAFGERLEKWVADQPVAQKAAKAGA